MRRVNGLDVITSLEDACDPARLALLVYDMQVGICRQLRDGDAIVARVATVLEAARSSGIRVAFTRHLSLPTAWLGAAGYRMAMAWQRTEDPAAVSPWFLRGTPGQAIVRELAPRADEAVFDKTAMSAFEGTPLNTALRDCGVTVVAVTGIAMEVGIEPTIRHAADLGYVPVVLADACGAGNAEAAERSLASLRFAGDAIVTDSGAFRAALRTAAARPPPGSIAP